MNSKKILRNIIREAFENELNKSINQTNFPKSVGENMAGNKLPTVEEVYEILKSEEEQQGGSWIDNEFGDARFDNEEQAKLYAQEVYNFLVSLGKEKTIPVYRAVSAEDVDLTPYGIGESWSFSLDAAKQFARQNLGGKNIKIIRGYVPSQNVDWNMAVRLYHNFSDITSGESEFELPIPSNNKILNVDVVDYKDAKELEETYLKNIIKEEFNNDALKNVKYKLRYPKRNVLVYVSPEKLLQKAAIDNPDYDVTNKKNQIGNRVQKAKDFLNNYLNDNHLINPKTGERTKYEVEFEPSVVSFNSGRVGFEDGRHRVLAAKELGLKNVGIEVPKYQEEYFKSNFLTENSIITENTELSILPSVVNLNWSKTPKYKTIPIQTKILKIEDLKGSKQADVLRKSAKYSEKSTIPYIMDLGTLNSWPWEKYVLTDSNKKYCYIYSKDGVVTMNVFKIGEQVKKS